MAGTMPAWIPTHSEPGRSGAATSARVSEPEPPERSGRIRCGGRGRAVIWKWIPVYRRPRRCQVARGARKTRKERPGLGRAAETPLPGRAGARKKAGPEARSGRGGCRCQVARECASSVGPRRTPLPGRAGVRKLGRAAEVTAFARFQAPPSAVRPRRPRPARPPARTRGSRPATAPPRRSASSCGRRTRPPDPRRSGRR